MRTSLCIALLGPLAWPAALVGQANPVSAAVRSMASGSGKHLLAAAEAMPAEKYAFKPTPAHMTFGELIAHIRRDNRSTCASFSGLKPDPEADPAPGDPKDKLVATLARSLTFCDSALARLKDAELGDPVSWYGRSVSRVTAAIGLLTDWADHYGQQAMYLRLNGVLPPTAKPAAPQGSTGPEGSHDFDFEIGSWKVHNSRLLHPLTGSQSWIQFEGTSVARKVWGGRADLLELESDSPAGHSEGLILRLFNPQSRQWSVSFASMNHGMLSAPTIGEFKDGRGEFYGQEQVNGRIVYSRSVLSNITPTSYRLEQAFSGDGGKTWEVNWISEHTRTP